VCARSAGQDGCRARATRWETTVAIIRRPDKAKNVLLRKIILRCGCLTVDWATGNGRGAAGQTLRAIVCREKGARCTLHLTGVVEIGLNSTLCD